MRLAIAGHGFVGRAYEQLLKNTCDISIYDPPKGYLKLVKNTDGVLVCVPTPQDTDGSCNMSHVFNVIDAVKNKDTHILIKSTISLQGWESIKQRYPDYKISFSPEFLRADTAVDDVLTQNDVLISYDEGFLFWAAVFENVNKTVSVYKAEELILTKYFRNSFLATKVSFCNQMYDLCQAANVNYENVRALFSIDERIGPSHTYVTGQRGFGGYCFPKDTSAILKTAENINVDLSVIKEAVSYNEDITNRA